MVVKNLNLRIFVFCCVIGNVFAQQLDLHPFLQQTSGSWHRFSVTETGVQKLNRAFLERLGIPVDAIDPRTLQIFGRGGKMLPLENSDQVETLHENHILVVGEEDGRFDNEDYIMFMGYAGDTWNDESQTFLNIFHKSATYYITYGARFGKRQMVLEGKTTSSSISTKTGIYKTAIEQDKFNMGSLGRRWFGVRFTDEQSESFTLETPNVAVGSSIHLGARVAAVAANTTPSFLLESGGKSVEANLAKATKTVVATEPRTSFDQISGILYLELPASTEVSAKLSFTANSDFSANGYLDYIFAKYNRMLTGKGGGFLFTLNPHTSIQQLQIDDVSPTTTLWELESHVVHKVPSESTGFSAEVVVNDKSTYYLANDFKTPRIQRRNQQFTPSSFLRHFTELPPTEYVLITSEAFKTQAQRLVKHRKEHLGLEAHLVTLEEIYEAFSTGQQDIGAIRNFLRYLYLSQGKKLQYLCLFGDTSFDYQNRISKNNMIVPTFHSLNSFSLTNSFMSDDFFTMMDAGEGLLKSSDRMDMAVGRMVFSTADQARIVVDKVIAYEDPKNIGNWSNSFTLLSDDVDLEWEYVIQERLDALGDVLQRNKPFINVTKLHADAFQQVSSAGGDRYPDVERALESRLSQGTLVVNYFGHGGEDGLAKEFLVDKQMAATLFHPNKYPLFITSTCEFSRFDNPNRPTAGELIYQNPTGGAVGLISTTRQIYVTNGINYNDILSKYLFSFGSEAYTSVAEALKRAKSEFSDTNQKRIIFYIGDPALKLHIPRPKVSITHLNGLPISNLSAQERQLKALDKISLAGAVEDGEGNPLALFNGTVSIQLFDKDVSRTTLGNDGHKKLLFGTLGQQLFQGAATVKNGKFSVTFMVPKDIELDIGKARVYILAYNEDKSLTLGGFSNELNLGGINTNAASDNQGPEVQVFLNDRSFSSGDAVFDSPVLIVDLADENGINTSGGIGHDITAVLDGNQTNPYLLNPYYSTVLDDFTKGSLSFPLKDLALGEHTLSVKAWDTHNNPNTKTIRFRVKDSKSIQIERVYNSPNPFKEQTTFFIHHNKSRELLQANLYIFTADGKRIWHATENIFSTGYVVADLQWDATSYRGEKVQAGTYLYTIELISTLSQTTDTHSGKLIIH